MREGLYTFSIPSQRSRRILMHTKFPSSPPLMLLATRQFVVTCGVTILHIPSGGSGDAGDAFPRIVSCYSWGYRRAIVFTCRQNCICIDVHGRCILKLVLPLCSLLRHDLAGSTTARRLEESRTQTGATKGTLRRRRKKIWNRIFWVRLPQDRQSMWNPSSAVWGWWKCILQFLVDPLAFHNTGWWTITLLITYCAPIRSCHPCVCAFFPIDSVICVRHFGALHILVFMVLPDGYAGVT